MSSTAVAVKSPNAPVDWDEHQSRITQIRERQEANRFESLKMCDPLYAARIEAAKPQYEFTISCEFAKRNARGALYPEKLSGTVIALDESHAWSLFLNQNDLMLGPNEGVRKITKGKRIN